MTVFYNTLTRKKEEFTPLVPGEVKMYNCGPTVYSSPHIGNLRSYVFSDSLKRLFLFDGLKVKQVINITDVGHLVSADDEGRDDSGEDKIEKAAVAAHTDVHEITKKYTTEFMDDLAALNINTTETIFPYATEHINEQIDLIKKLEAGGHTYTTTDGIYFDTETFPSYGKLGGIDVIKLKEGARVKKNQEKRHPTDFALWKFSTKPGLRQQEWPSPWGVGFPGWHIECSAMSMKYLGETFDIHTGGIDHIGVHHNNEIAQSECTTGKPLAHFWLHNAFLVGAEGDKLSKSKGEIKTLQFLKAQGIPPLAFRYWLLTARYSTPLTYSLDALQNARQSYVNLLNELTDLPENGIADKSYVKKIREAYADDLDTPKAVAFLWELLKSDLSPANKLATILDVDALFGLDFKNQIKHLTDIPDEIKQKVAARDDARKKADWETADLLRQEINTAGFEVLDSDTSSTKIRRLTL